MLKKVSTQKKSDSRDIEMQKLEKFNLKLKSQIINLKEKVVNLKTQNLKLKENNLVLKDKLSKRGRRIEDFIAEDLNEKGEE